MTDELLRNELLMVSFGATIVLIHSTAESWADTPWPQHNFAIDVFYR